MPKLTRSAVFNVNMRNYSLFVPAVTAGTRLKAGDECQV